MENEIDYTIMRYILDSNGYVEEVSFGAIIGCGDKESVEYTGKIPTGYESLVDWQLNANIRAYKIVEGDLVHDANRESELELIYEEEQRNNRHVTYGEVQGMLNNLDIEVSNQAELEGILPIRTEEGEVIYLDDSSSYPVERMLLTSKGTISDVLNLYISTSNMLPNEAINGNKSGITYTVNEDKSMDLSGTVTEAFSLTISGNETNTVPLFIFKAGLTYYINKVSDTVSLNLYSNDGTERTLVYSGTGETSITLEEEAAITHAELSIVSGSVNETVSLMVSVGDAAKEYEQCNYTIVPINLYNNTFELDEEMTIEYGLVQIEGTGVDIIDMPCTYYEKTTMYTDKGTVLEIDYKKSGFDTVTKRGKGSLTLRNTADGYGSIFNFKMEDLDGGAIYTLETSDGGDESEQYKIDLTEYTGSVDVIIEEGQTGVYQGDVLLDFLDSIYIRTYSPRTYIELLDCTNRLTCEYMLESDFSVYCTRVEKEASIKVLDDKISLEVKRASEKEGKLEGKIEIEAGKIEQIVTSVGADGEVTAASIITAINEGESEIQINADKIDITGKTLPTIKNNADTCSIQSQDIAILGMEAIKYKADVHQFEYNSVDADSDFRVITKFFHFLGNEFRITGDFYINGKKFDPNSTGSGGGGSQLIQTSVNLYASGWVENTQSVAVTGVTASNTVWLAPIPEIQHLYTNYNIICTAQEDGILTFSCEFAPEEDLIVNVVIGESSLASSLTQVAATLTLADWVENKQTIALENVSLETIVWVSPNPASNETYTTSEILCVEQNQGTLTFSCTELPTEDVLINIILAN